MREKLICGVAFVGVLTVILAGPGALIAQEARGHAIDRLPEVAACADATELKFHATGARDSNKVATVVHCTNIGSVDATVCIEVRDFDGFIGCTLDGVSVDASDTRTMATQDTVIYFEDAVCAAPPTTEQGSVWIHVDPTQGRDIICSVQIVDKTSQPPAFATTLDLFGRIR